MKTALVLLALVLSVSFGAFAQSRGGGGRPMGSTRDPQPAPPAADSPSREGVSRPVTPSVRDNPPPPAPENPQPAPTQPYRPDPGPPGPDPEPSPEPPPIEVIYVPVPEPAPVAVPQPLVVPEFHVVTDVVIADSSQDPGSSGYDFSRDRILPLNDPNSDLFLVIYGRQGVLKVDSFSDIQDIGGSPTFVKLDVPPEGGWSPSHAEKVFSGHSYIVWTRDDQFYELRVTAVTPFLVRFDWIAVYGEGFPLSHKSIPGAHPVGSKFDR